jgi:hypothetical protein
VDGATGVTGVDGATGATGVDGATGVTGATGPNVNAVFVQSSASGTFNLTTSLQNAISINSPIGQVGTTPSDPIERGDVYQLSLGGQGQLWFNSNNSVIVEVAVSSSTEPTIPIEYSGTLLSIPSSTFTTNVCAWNCTFVFTFRPQNGGPLFVQGSMTASSVTAAAETYTTTRGFTFLSLSNFYIPTAHTDLKFFVFFRTEGAPLNAGVTFNTQYCNLTRIN